jgi:hypothetical protein
MLYKIKQFWNSHGLTVLVIVSIGFIVAMWLINRKKKPEGSYDYSWKQLKDDLPEIAATMATEARHVQKPRSRSPSPPSSPSTTATTVTGKPSRKKESAGETECRRVMQEIFQKPFPNCRPKFMFNSVTGENLELDLFNKDLKLAVEYNGRQHYEYTPYFHRTKDAFYGQQYRDKMKRESCAKLGINLIEVHYKEKDIEGYLRKKAKELGYSI